MNMTLACLLFAMLPTTLERETIIGVTSHFWGATDTSCSISVVPFQTIQGARSVKNGQLLLNGRLVWLWSIEDAPPKNAVTSIRLDVGGRRLAFPSTLLEGLVDLHIVKQPTLHHVSASLYMDRKRENWCLAMWFADGGASFSATFSGTAMSRMITREIYKDGGKLVEKRTAQGNYIKAE